jgi:RNA polymerase sigma-70 factor, ECF subfamily
MATRSTSIFPEETGLGTALNQALQTCPEVLSLIYTTHYHHVFQVCRRFFRQPEDAEDAAAEVFLKLHTVLEKKNGSHPFRPWVCQVAGRHCIDKLRRRKREKCSTIAGINLCAVPDVSTPSPLSQVLRKEAKRELREQLNRLPDYYKVPLMLRYYKRMSYSEIARALNCRLPAVKTIIFRAKNRLRRNLGYLERARQAPGPCTRFPGGVSNDQIPDLQHPRNPLSLLDPQNLPKPRAASE